MKIHHINCGTLCPAAFGFVKGSTSLVCHCLVIEGSRSLTLVDTGHGTLDVTKPNSRLGWHHPLLGPRLDKNETAFEQIKKMGYEPNDVTDIILTHLDSDHAGGISDFPHATVHVSENEYQRANNRKSLFDFFRYSPAQFRNHKKWNFYNIDHSTEIWNGFHSIIVNPQLGEDLLLIPLLGHTLGHCGVAIQNNNQWLLHAGDSYFYHQTIHPQFPKTPLFIERFESTVAQNNTLRLSNQQKLRSLNSQKEIKIFCSHDPSEYYKWNL